MKSDRNEPTDPTIGEAMTMAAQAPRTSGPKDGALAATEVAHASIPVAIDVAVAPLEEHGFGERYEGKSLLGAGGMGEVRVYRDRRIGRDVALKVMRPGTGSSDGASASRFIREARVQGQLEHPSIVPVYDAGIGPDGAPYFTMKRVRGATLHEVLVALSEKRPEAIATYSRRKLLTAFSNVCLSIDFAHARGVVHRDLKPSNVMLGDFGEVHVLDWGVAKIVGAPDDAAAAAGELETGKTAVGSVMGTPGYMPPEQARGEVDKLDARTDVYALGAILFEILALEPLHRGSTMRQLLSFDGIERRPSVRAPESDVPPELDAICVRALEPEASARFASARELSDALERFLDGDRDVAVRREMAAGHVERALAACARAERADAEESAHGEAMREATRALSLDPMDERAGGILARLLMAAPKRMPREAEAEFADRKAHTSRKVARLSAQRLAGLTLALPIVVWMGVRNWLALGLIPCLFAAAAIATVILGRRPSEAGKSLLLVPFLLTSLAVAMFSGVFGVVVLVPTLALLNSALFAGQADFRMSKAMLAIGALPVLLPLVLEYAGLVPPAMSFVDGTIHLLPRLLDLPEMPARPLLYVTALGMSTLPLAIVGRMRGTLMDSERRLFLQAWHLRQLLPEAARRGVAS